MRRPWMRGVLAVVMIVCAAVSVAKASEQCSIYMVCDPPYCALAFSCIQGVDCLTCYATSTPFQ
jgi:hypothetical protein